ncbi:MAG: hypothetical protein R3321_11485 [Nitrososphaeraceae archaeon]|nr:hypothetical protein [Nitrososphaeraceae archaeon]
MTKIRIPHQYHESNISTPPVICRKCNIEKPRTCELCGICYSCHQEGREKEDY